MMKKSGDKREKCGKNPEGADAGAQNLTKAPRYDILE